MRNLWRKWGCSRSISDFCGSVYPDLPDNIFRNFSEFYYGKRSRCVDLLNSYMITLKNVSGYIKRGRYYKMGERLERLKRTFRRKTAWFLAVVMLGMYETTALGTIMVYALPDLAAVDEEAEDEDRYSFRLEDETDITLSLESDYPCDLELISKERVIGESGKPYSQILKPAGLEAGTYTVRIVPNEGTERASYTLRVAGRRMETGWVYDPSFQRWFYLEENGAMTVGWREIDGKWYYFHTESDGGKGKMYAGERTPDGYKTGPNGEWVP